MPGTVEKSCKVCTGKPKGKKPNGRKGLTETGRQLASSVSGQGPTAGLVNKVMNIPVPLKAESLSTT
jgi:hypothetical protein